jgi:hypothetical protein
VVRPGPLADGTDTPAGTVLKHAELRPSTAPVAMRGDPPFRRSAGPAQRQQDPGS